MRKEENTKNTPNSSGRYPFHGSPARMAEAIQSGGPARTTYPVQSGGCSMKKGFTLVEVLVSVAIFAIVVLVATSSVFTIVSANKKAHALKSVMTNLNFALESMAREMRVGSDFKCLDSTDFPASNDGDNGNINNCANGNVGFSFNSNRNFGGSSLIRYRFKTDGNGVVRIEQSLGISVFVPITASEINLNSAGSKFYVTGVGTSDFLQPRVLITISGTISKGGQISTFNVQTMSSQRLLDR